MIRILKAILIVIVALHALFYAVNNIVNLGAAHQAVAYVMSMADNNVYPDHFGPPITTPALTWLAVWMVITGETLVAIFGLKGALDMASAIGKPASSFNASKKFAILSCCLAIFVWMGFFMTIGSAYFQMWQTEVGDGSLKGAFMFAASSGIVLLFVNQPDN